MPARLIDGGPRVLMTADSVGGVWTYAISAAEGLAAAGVAVDLAVLGPPPSSGQRAWAASMPRLTLHELEGPLDWLACDAVGLQPIATALRRLAARRRADIVHLSSPALAALVDFDQPVIGVCHSCVATWWVAMRPGEALPPHLAWRRDLLGRGYAACGLLLAPTMAFAAATRAIYGVTPSVVHNGRRAPARQEARTERFALAAGRMWDESKGATTLDAIAELLTVPLVALGALEGPGGERVRLDRVRAEGALDRGAVADWMARAPVFVSTARYEPFGLAVLEAAQAGCALVLSDIPSMRELWEGAAVFAPAEDAGAFARAIESRLDDPATLDRARSAASRRAQRFSVEAMVAAILDAYRTLSPAAFGERSLLGAAV